MATPLMPANALTCISKAALSRSFLRSYSRVSSDRFSRRPQNPIPAKFPVKAQTKSPTFSAGLESVLMNPQILVGRQMEMMNLFLGFEQANKYSIKLPTGVDVGFIAEEASSFKNVFLRQLMKTRRKMDVTVMDTTGIPVLTVSFN